MSISFFEEGRFRKQVSATLSKLRTILDNTRSPEYPADVPHTYDDKYGLAEFLTNTSIAAGHECLTQLGLSAQGFQQLVSWAAQRSVTLRFSASERCTYLRETTRNVESATHETDTTLFGKFSSKVVTKVVEHFWQFDSSWQLIAFVGTGNDAGDRVELIGRKGSCELMTSNKSTPRVESRVCAPIDVRLTWLLQQTSQTGLMPQFTIQRSDPACRTPRRNPQVEQALSFHIDFYSWAKQVHRYLLSELIPVHSQSGLDISNISDDTLFVPVAPLFEQGKKGAPIPPHLRTAAAAGPGAALPAGEEGAAASASSASSAVVVAAPNSALLPIGDVNKFLSEQRRSFREKNEQLAQVFPSSAQGKLCSIVEASVLVVLMHISRLAQAYSDGVDYIELLLRRQLIAAVGREMTAIDFSNYMRFHYRKLYRPAFEPKPFCYNIRRPDHYPEGVLSIDATPVPEPIPESTVRRTGQHPHDLVRQTCPYPSGAFSCDVCGVHGGRNEQVWHCDFCAWDAHTHCLWPEPIPPPVPLNVEPILTSVRSVQPAFPMHFSISAATNIVFGGQRYLHGYVSQQFSGQPVPQLTLTARARQFSSFIVLIGTLGGPSLFLPKHAMLIQNKDELVIPLNTETIPSAKEFAEAVESMSPEQQRFAKMYRSMQLEGSLFGVLVLQIKPQLEKLLRLPDDALTKEIRLTQDLLELFSKYQIPPDLLSYAGEPSASVSTKVAQVQGHVQKMHAMIQKIKDDEEAERTQVQQ
jgi:hypothetical protein